MTGQEAVHVAEAFAAAVPVTGLVLTKIDGDARGGAALSISAVTGLPVKFLARARRRTLLSRSTPIGWPAESSDGDVLTLIERAQDTFDEKQAPRWPRRFERTASPRRHARADAAGPEDGRGRNLLEMIPGMGGMAKQAQASVDRGISSGSRR